MAWITLSNVFELRFQSTEELLNFVSDGVQFNDAVGVGELEYSYKAIDDAETVCAESEIKGRHRKFRYPILGVGRICVHPEDPSVLAVMEYYHASKRKLRGKRKKAFLASARDFLKSIKLTPIDYSN
jgi:hypothetical protein